MWRRKREGVIQELIIKHAELVLNTVQALHEYIRVVRKKKPEKRLVETEEELGEKVLKLERKADEIEEKINEELFRGAFLPVTSSDRYDLIAAIVARIPNNEKNAEKNAILDKASTGPPGL